MPTWNDFASPVTRATATPVIGCYLSPRVLLTTPDLNDPISPLRIGWRIWVNGVEVLVTVGSGLFVEPPMELLTDDPVVGFEEKLEFEERTARALNMVVCELTLHGAVSEPAAPAFISRGTMIDGHVAILGGGGGRESYLDRHIDWLHDLQAMRWLARPLRGVDVLDHAAHLPDASKIAELSPHGPALVAGAYSNFSRMQHAEAMADAWIVIERYLEYLWSGYIATPKNRPRKAATAAVKLDVLTRNNLIDANLFKHLDVARVHRNNLVHGADVKREASVAVLEALHEMLKVRCGRDVAAPLENRGISW